MHHFTPWSALEGGLLIGTAAVLLLWFTGRIAGVSGIAGHLGTAARGDRLWRGAFVAGLLLGAGLWVAFGGAVPVREGFPRGLLIAAGLLVGYGTALGNGCTSGHGVCGTARLSRRSIAATATFLGVAIVTTFVARHVAGVAL